MFVYGWSVLGLRFGFLIILFFYLMRSFVLGVKDHPLVVRSGWHDPSVLSLRRRQSNPLVYTVCVLVHDILFQIPLSRKDIYSRF